MAVKSIRRESWVILLVFLHLFAAPCATAMVLMPADMDCEHCQTIDAPDACAVASAVTSSVLGGVAFDSGRGEPPLRVAGFSPLLPAVLTPELPEAMLLAQSLAQRSRLMATRHSGDPPLYLLLGQLRI